MTKATKKLNNILDLESEKYQDRAVFGGLGKYAETWTKEGKETFGPSAQTWVQDIADLLRQYSTLSDINERRQLLPHIQKMLNDTPPPQPEEAPAPPSPQPQASPAAATTSPEKAEPETEPTPPTPAKKSSKRTGLASPITALKGVGPRQSKRLSKLGLHTIHDMLYFFPHRYDDYTQLKPINRLEYNEEVTIIAQVKAANVRKTRSGKKLFKATLFDGTASIEVTWFNQPFLANKIKPGEQIVISGKVDEYLGRLCFNSPEWELVEKELLHTARLVPVYPLTKGVYAKWLRRLMKRTVDYWSKRQPDYLPQTVREQNELLDLETALLQIHFPENKRLLAQARKRLSFDEVFIVQIGLLRQRQAWRAEPGRPLPVTAESIASFIDSLPYQLTTAQQRALSQIMDDLREEHPMNRLMQGDVGSGKTVVAAAAMAAVVSAGSQAALMAPTAILAEQHYHTLQTLFANWPEHAPTIRLLTGNITGQEREEIYAGLTDGCIDIVIGTHALIQEHVTFKDLVLAVIDEQHRFGVKQRAALRQKGYNPHLLVMTATPIPRSLELTIWGHLDVSTIDEMPPGRQPVTTRLILPTERERAYSFLRSQIDEERQAFIICPLVEESDKIEAKSAVEEHQRLQSNIFPDLSLGLLHGRMKGEEKENIMAQFVQGELDILVATSVVEVGIDVPNATVMLIEGADRFGLAQIHQFRGRVGRGEHASYCLLVSDSSSEEAQERLKAVEATNDGFVLAEKDLEMRGPGEFLGTRQSGFPNLKLANMTDLPLIEKARTAARQFFETDPQLTQPENRLLAQEVAQFWQEGDVS